MLNTNIYHNESTVVAVTKEIEKTISPDKVTEMYDKVKLEVQDDFVRKLFVKTDILNGVICEFSDRHDTAQRLYLTRFVLNDKEYIIRDTQEVSGITSDEQMLRIFSENYKKEIERQIIRTVFHVLLNK